MRDLICFRHCQNFFVFGLKEKLQHQEKNNEFHIILKYRSLPETSLRSFTTVVAGSESRLQTNQPFCPCSISQKIQSSKRCWHGTYCWVIGYLALFDFFVRLLWNWEWPFSHGLQNGSQQQNLQVAIEILEEHLEISKYSWPQWWPGDYSLEKGSSKSREGQHE